MILLINFEKDFAMNLARKKEARPVRIIAARIIIKEEKLKSGSIDCSATAVPVLVSPREYKVTNDKPEITILIIPSKIKNSFLLNSPSKSLPITAACPLPRAGRKEQRGATKPEAKTGFKN